MPTYNGDTIPARRDPMQNTVTNLFGDPQQPVAAAHRARVVAITSGKGGVGKTSITANIAVALALAGKRVCLVRPIFFQMKQELP